MLPEKYPYKYRVWNIVNVPNKPRYYYVASPEEGARTINALAHCQLLVPEDIIASNVFGLEEWVDNFDGDGNDGWCEWENLDESSPNYGDGEKYLCDLEKDKLKGLEND